MMLTLNISSIRSLLAGQSKSGRLALPDVPSMTRNELGLHGVTMTTGVLTGATRKVLEQLRDRGDKAGCAVLGLIESDPVQLADPDDDKGLSGVERMLRVLQAASVLGCNAVGVRVPGPATDAAADLATERLKLVTERAEKLEINVLIIPQPGLSATPERLTTLVKAVGGFRIGTLPEFDAAAASADPTTYLKRLTPYASLVNAVTLGFTEPDPAAPAPTPQPAGRPADNPAPALSPIVGLDLGEDDADAPLPGGADPAPAKSGKKTAKKATSKAPAKAAAKAAPKPPPPPAEEEDDEEGFDDADLAALLAEAAAELADEPPPPPPVHTAFPLEPLVAAIVAVGFDGTLAIEYRGPGDCKLGVIQSREALDAALQAAADR